MTSKTQNILIVGALGVGIYFLIKQKQPALLKKVQDEQAKERSSKSDKPLLSFKKNITPQGKRLVRFFKKNINPPASKGLTPQGKKIISVIRNLPKPKLTQQGKSSVDFFRRNINLPASKGLTLQGEKIKSYLSGFMSRFRK